MFASLSLAGVRRRAALLCPLLLVSCGAGESYVPPEQGPRFVRDPAPLLFPPHEEDGQGLGGGEGNAESPSASTPFQVEFDQSGSGAVLLSDPWRNANQFCGDGVLDPTREECDDGQGAGAACTDQCQTVDFVLSGGKDKSRTLGQSHHSFAPGRPNWVTQPPGSPSAGLVTWVEQAAGVPLVRAQVLDFQGNPLTTSTRLEDGRFSAAVASLLTVSDGTEPSLAAAPVAAPLGASGDPRIQTYVLGWNDINGDGAEMSVALRLLTVDASGSGAVSLGSVFHAPSVSSSTGLGAQQDLDLVGLANGEVAAAWVDTSDPATGPDVRFARISASGFSGAPISLGLSALPESAVTLAPIPGPTGDVLYALRRSESDGSESIVVGRVPEQGAPAEPVLVSASGAGPAKAGPGPEGERPAIVALANGWALVVFSVGTDPGATGVYSVMRLWGAVVHPGARSVAWKGALDGLTALADTSLDQRSPVLVDDPLVVTDANGPAGSDSLFLAFRSASPLGSAQGEELSIQNVLFSATTPSTGQSYASSTAVGLKLSYQAPKALSRTPTTAGDQRRPSLAVLPVPGGQALGIAWEDWGTKNWTDAAAPELVLQVAGLPIRRGPSATCTTNCTATSGPCTANANCAAGLSCNPKRGAYYGFGADSSICELSTCADGSKNGDETGIDCGGSCGTCFSCPSGPAHEGTAAYCSAVCPCSNKLGDCDTSGECRSGLLCVKDSGPYMGWPASVDVCMVPHCANGTKDGGEVRMDCGGPDCAACQNGIGEFCSGAVPCWMGEGSCSSSSECRSGTQCISDQASLFGLPAGTNVCVMPGCTADRGTPNTSGFCTSSCPCVEGTGICTSNTECAGSYDATGTLTAGRCATERGLYHGLSATAAVCEPPHCADGLKNYDESAIDCGGVCGTECPICPLDITFSSFENPTADWGKPMWQGGGASAAVSKSTTDFTHGTGALKITAPGLTELWSRNFGAHEFPVLGDKLQIDFSFRAAAAVPVGAQVGTVALDLVRPSGTRTNLFYEGVLGRGYANVWTTFTRTIPSDLRAELATASFGYRFELKVNLVRAESIVIDNLRFTGGVSFRSSCVDPGDVGPLTATEARVLSFEDATKWTGTPSATAVEPTRKTDRAQSLKVISSTSTVYKFTSATLAADKLNETDRLAIDIQAPTSSGTLGGTAAVFLTCTGSGAGAYSGSLGSVSLTGAPAGRWETRYLTVPAAAKAALATTAPCTLRLESTVTAGAASSFIYYDNLRFVGSSHCNMYPQTATAPFATGMPVTPDGTQANPYRICNTAQFTTVANDTGTLHNKVYVLEADLDLTGVSGQLGSTALPFKGEFLGNGHILRNYTAGAGGLFNIIVGDGTLDGSLDGYVHDLILANFTITGTNQVGALAGTLTSGRVERVTVSGGLVTGSGTNVGGMLGSSTGPVNDCHSSIQVKGTSSGSTGLGGMIGKATGALSLLRSYGVVETLGTNTNVGGIVGETTSTSAITSSWRWGVMTVTGTSVGGLIGKAAQTVTSCNSAGTITHTGTGVEVGGLVGRLQATTVTRSSSSTNVTAGGTSVGGLVGYATGATITRSSAIGSVASTVGDVGGLVGTTATPASSFSDVFATGAVSGTSAVGGLLGRGNTVTVTRAYSTGVVTGNPAPGSVVGVATTVTISGSYTLSSVNTSLNPVGSNSAATGVTKITATQFTNSSTFTGWDFSTIWLSGSPSPSLR